MTNCNKSDCSILDQYNNCANKNPNDCNINCLTDCGFSNSQAQDFFECVKDNPDKSISCLDKLGVSSTCIDYINNNKRSDCGGDSKGGSDKFFTEPVIIGFSVGGGILAFLILLSIILYFYKKTK